MKETATSTEPRELTIDGFQVLMTPEQYHSWNRFIYKIRNDARKTRSCAQPNYRLCIGDCEQCIWYKRNMLLSIDYENGWHPCMETQETERNVMENQIIDKLTCESIYQFVRELYPEGDRILYAYAEEHMKVTEIARMLSLPRETVRYRLKHILSILHENACRFN